MRFSKDTSIPGIEALWTVTQLTEAMDSLGTAEDSRPQPGHNLLGQVIVWTSDLTTAAWITAAAVTHTDHSVYDYEIFLQGGKEEKKKGIQMDDPGNLFPLTQNLSWLDVHGEV